MDPEDESNPFLLRLSDESFLAGAIERASFVLKVRSQRQYERLLKIKEKKTKHRYPRVNYKAPAAKHRSLRIVKRGRSLANR